MGRGITLLFVGRSALGGVGGQPQAPAASTPGKNPVPNVQEDNEWIRNLLNKQLFTVTVEQQGGRANDYCYRDLIGDAVLTAEPIPNMVTRKNMRCKI